MPFYEAIDNLKIQHGGWPLRCICHLSSIAKTKPNTEDNKHNYCDYTSIITKVIGIFKVQDRDWLPYSILEFTVYNPNYSMSNTEET